MGLWLGTPLRPWHGGHRQLAGANATARRAHHHATGIGPVYSSTTYSLRPRHKKNCLRLSGCTQQDCNVFTNNECKLAYVAACSQSTMVVTADCVLWVCNFGIYGQLGTGTNENALIPTRVVGSDRFGGEGVRMMACSNNDSLILGTDNRVLSREMFEEGDRCKPEQPSIPLPINVVLCNMTTIRQVQCNSPEQAAVKA